jgi:hypothetical protein
MINLKLSALSAATRLGLVCGLMGMGGQVHASVHALLIGITDYKAANISDLQGPANDIQLMNEVLTDRFKVPAANITLLRNGTHSQIEKAFADLTARVRQGDQVYIHYSGHGSWYRSPDPAERRGQDQTWVSHGARVVPDSTNKDDNDVLDKEIGTWLQKLYKVTDDVVLVSDSCHSASVTRDVQVGARSSDGLLKVHPLRDQFPEKIEFPENAGLRIGAARDIESAVELDAQTRTRCVDAKHCYGVFTWNWAEALRVSRPGESWGDVYSRTLAAIEANPLVLQRPQKEGNDKRAVFEGKFAELTSTVAVRKVEPNGTVVIGAGRLSGLTVGSALIGADGDPAQAPRLEVIGAEASNAQAKVLSGAVTAGLLLKVSDYKAVEPRMALHVGGPQASGIDASLAARVRQAIEQARRSTLSNFDLVDQQSDAQCAWSWCDPSLPRHHRTTGCPSMCSARPSPAAAPSCGSSPPTAS